MKSFHYFLLGNKGFFIAYDLSTFDRISRLLLNTDLDHEGVIDFMITHCSMYGIILQGHVQSRAYKTDIVGSTFIAHEDENDQTSKVTPKTLEELGERLYVKIKEVVIPEWQEAFNSLTPQDCVDYIFNLTINRTFDGFLREKSVVTDTLAEDFPDVRFEESDPVLDHAGDIDYIGWVGNKAFGIQIKPVTAKANFGNYSPSERMKSSFTEFENKYGGKVFIVFSVDDKIENINIVEDIRKEIERLSKKK